MRTHFFFCLSLFAFFSSHLFSASSNSFYMIFLSDTQFPWACPVRNQSKIPCDDKKRATLDAIMQMRWLRAKVLELGVENVKGVVINGDLTAFGHEEEFKSFLALWVLPLKALGLKIYPGLGNHDFENNVDDCYNNNCASRMYTYMRNFIISQAPLLSSFDYRASKIYYKFPSNRVDHRGSLSYSWDEGDIHFVQLHNHPAYKKEWSSWNGGKILRDFYYVEPSFEWLRADLKKAKKRGKKIIVSMHDMGAGFYHPEFKKLMKDYNISAVFAGHWHQYVGKKDAGSAYSVPVYLAGASVYRSALVTKFENGKKMLIEAYRGRQHSADDFEKASTSYFEEPLLEP